jgi:cell division protein FtsW
MSRLGLKRPNQTARVRDLIGSRADSRVSTPNPPRNEPRRSTSEPQAPATLRTRVLSAVRDPSWPKVLGSSDGVLFGAVMALVVFGVVMVYSASSVRAVRLYGDGHHFLIRQAVYAALGLPMLVVLSRIDYHRYRTLGKPVLFVAASLLLAVIFGAGRAAGGAARWIQVGPVNVQPAEVAKVALILWLADSLATKVDRIRSFSIGFLPHVLMAGALVVLCMAQPDFGSSVILMLLTFVLLFTAGAKIGYMAGGAAIALPIAFLLVHSSAYRWNRIIAFTDPFKYRTSGGYQIVESWMSFGAGGLWGVGLGDSRQKLLFLPEAHTDFIGAIVAEELGFIGFSLLILAFAVVVVRGMRAALRSVDEYGLYLGVGLSMFIGIQVVTNLAVVLGLLPTKGLTLPFLSFGGSSLLVNCAAAGMLLNVSRPRRASAGADASDAGRESDGKSARSGEKNRRLFVGSAEVATRAAGLSMEGVAP